MKVMIEKWEWEISRSLYMLTGASITEERGDQCQRGRQDNTERQAVNGRVVRFPGSFMALVRSKRKEPESRGALIPVGLFAATMNMFGRPGHG